MKVTALPLLLLFCACTSAGLPDDQPDISGLVTEVDRAGRILVEERPGEQNGGAKCWVDVSRARFVAQDKGGSRNTGAAPPLKGQRLSAWFEGGVAESYPCQATAGIILILETPG